MNLREVTGDDQLHLLVSKRDRIVCIYRPNDDPMFRDGMELVASVTVVADPGGDISIGVLHNPDDTIDIKFMDEPTGER
jgi:hypothetical protein